MSITVFGLNLSPFVRKVLVAMDEKGIEYELKPVNIFPAPDWFEEISPLKRIPVFKEEFDDGTDVVIPDSSAILGYLEKRTPSPALLPENPAEAGRALWYEEYADSALAMEVGMGVFRPIFLNTMMGNEPDTERAAKTMGEKLPPYFDYLESQIKDREFFVGDSFTIADLSVVTQFINLRHAQNTPDPATWPALDDFINRMCERPVIAKHLAVEREMAPGSIA